MTSTIWTSYHLPNIPEEYNLKENDNIKLFCTRDFSLKENNINYLNEYLGELCTMYYVWKNNIKTDYVGFQHYRYLLSNINNENNILIEGDAYHLDHTTNLFSLFIYFGFSEHTTYLLLTYLSKYFNYDLMSTINMHLLNTNYPSFFMNTFYCSWDVFNEFCKFYFGFLNYLFPNESWKNRKVLNEYIYNLYILNANNYNLKENCNYHSRGESQCALFYYPNDKRYFTFLAEVTLPLFFNIKYRKLIKTNINKKQIIFDLKNRNIDYVLFGKFIHKNYFTGIKNILVFNYKNTDLYKSSIDNFGIKRDLRFVKFCDEDINDFEIDNVNNYKLNFGEYIDVKSPIDFHKNNNFEIKML